MCILCSPPPAVQKKRHQQSLNILDCPISDIVWMKGSTSKPVDPDRFLELTKQYIPRYHDIEYTKNILKQRKQSPSLAYFALIHWDESISGLRYIADLIEV